MSEDVTYQPVPRLFSGILLLVCLGAIAAGWLAPASWNATNWVGYPVFGMLSLQWAIWPESNPAFHPFGVRLVALLFLAALAFTLIF